MFGLPTMTPPLFFFLCAQKFGHELPLYRSEVNALAANGLADDDLCPPLPSSVRRHMLALNAAVSLFLIRVKYSVPESRPRRVALAHSPSPFCLTSDETL